MTTPTAESWLKAHPYLESVARLQRVIDEAAAKGDGAAIAEPAWARYEAEFANGVPLLRSGAAPDLAPAAETLRRVAERLAAAELPEPLAGEVKALKAELQAQPDAALRIVRALAGAAPGEDPGVPGLRAFLGWVALQHALAPVVAAYAAWRSDDRWDRPECPTCGAAPVLGHLVPEQSGRRRLLACGRCATRWSWKRVACPFCTTQNANQLAILEVEGEGGFRLDVCENCKGYLKTYGGQGNESFMLADWTTLHLDVLAKDRGYERKGHSLYEL